MRHDRWIHFGCLIVLIFTAACSRPRVHTYKYLYGDSQAAQGTITLHKQAQFCRVVGVTYQYSQNRDLISEVGVVEGGVVELLLRPKNGDTNYWARITLIFTEDEQTFDVEYEDSHGRKGDVGEFRGRLIHPATQAAIEPITQAAISPTSR